MPACLIINADDFGLTPGINRAIAELHDAGAITSATLMADGPAFDDAVALAKGRPALSIGCHIVLVDGMPAAAPESIPSLIGADGKSFRASLAEFVFATLAGRIHEDEVEREALAQVQKLQRAGIDVTHLDTHKHTHLFSTIARPLLHLAECCSIGAVRNPFEHPWSMQGSLRRRLQVHLLRRFRIQFYALPQIRSHAVATTDGTIGISATGDLDAAPLQRTLSSIPEGTWELVCHPGYNDEDLSAVNTRLREERNVERTALLDLIPHLSAQPNAPRLIHYGALGGISIKRELGQFTQPTGYEKVL